MVGDDQMAHGGHLTPASPGSVEVYIYREFRVYKLICKVT